MMNFFIQNMILAANSAVKPDAVVNQTKEAAHNEWLLSSWLWQFYMGHFTLINILLIVLIVIFIMRRFLSSINENYRDLNNKRIAEQLAAWLAPQGNYTKEELQPEFLLLLQGKESDLLSKVILGLRSEYKELDSGRFSCDFKVYYQKGEDVIQTTFSRNIEYEDLPSDVRHEMNKRNAATLVFDYLKQAFVEEK